MKSKNNIGIVCMLLLAGFLGSCKEEPSYDEVLKEELAREVRFDSVAYGVKLGMTYDDFKWRCLLQNRNGIFKPNSTGDAVQLTFTEGFAFPVHFEFFPADIKGEYEPVTKYDATIRYRDYSSFNKEMSMEKLVKETTRFFENGYGGREFIPIANEKDPWVKYNFVKVDGNRKITLVPVYMGSELIIRFEDLAADKKNPG